MISVTATQFSVGVSQILPLCHFSIKPSKWNRLKNWEEINRFERSPRTSLAPFCAAQKKTKTTRKLLFLHRLSLQTSRIRRIINRLHCCTAAITYVMPGHSRTLCGLSSPSWLNSCTCGGGRHWGWLFPWFLLPVWKLSAGLTLEKASKSVILLKWELPLGLELLLPWVWDETQAGGCVMCAGQSVLQTSSQSSAFSLDRDHGDVSSSWEEGLQPLRQCRCGGTEPGGD